VEGDGLFLACRSFLKMKKTAGVRVLLTAFTSRATGGFLALLLLGGGDELVVFFRLVVSLSSLTIGFDWQKGIGSKSIHFGHTPIETVCFRLRCDDTVVEPETTKAAVRLDEVLVGCSERAAFLAPRNDIPRATFICCTFFLASISGMLVKTQLVCLCS